MSGSTPIRSGARIVSFVPPLPAPAFPADVRRAVADEVEDALGDFERLPPDVAERMTALLHRLRTGRDG